MTPTTRRRILLVSLVMATYYTTSAAARDNPWDVVVALSGAQGSGEPGWLAVAQARFDP